MPLEEPLTLGFLRRCTANMSDDVIVLLRHPDHGALGDVSDLSKFPVTQELVETKTVIAAYLGVEPFYRYEKAETGDRYVDALVIE